MACPIRIAAGSGASPRAGGIVPLWAAAAAVLLLPRPAAATCGAEFCSINTDWDVQAPLTEAGTRVDLRFEYIDQDQPRSGRHEVGVGELPRHHDEERTVNRNYILAVDHKFNSNWGIGVTVPLVDRDHRHIHNHMGAQVPEAWDFTELGDIRVVGRYQVLGNNPENSYGALAGLKLPTGEFDLRNDEGAVAERSLQPGTGTTDAIVGAFYHDVAPWHDSTWFAQALYQQPLNERDDYKPGYQLHLDLGTAYQATDRLALLLQLNGSWKGRDSGDEAERGDSGSWKVAVSPGASYAVGERVSLYGFVQLPLYQYVNGVQLTADWALVLGVSARF